MGHLLAVLLSYQNGHRLDYRGARKLAELESYARRTTAASALVPDLPTVLHTDADHPFSYRGLQPLDYSTLDTLIQTESAFFIYLHSAESRADKAATVSADSLEVTPV